jgi:hypothetical protein
MLARRQAFGQRQFRDDSLAWKLPSIGHHRGESCSARHEIAGEFSHRFHSRAASIVTRNHNDEQPFINQCNQEGML